MLERLRLAEFDGLRWLAVVLAYAVVFIALDHISYLKPYGTFGATPWNPQAGVSVALIYLGGLSYAWPVLLISAVSNYILRNGPLGIWIELLTSVASGAAYVAGGFALQRLVPFEPTIRTLRDAINFITVACCVAVAAALLFTVMLGGAGELGRGDFPVVFWRMFIGDFIGILVVTPIILQLMTLRPLPKPADDWLYQLFAIVMVMIVIFGYKQATAFQLFYLLFLPLLWVALTYGIAGATAALAVIQVGLLLGAEFRFGNDPGLAALQALMVALTVTGLIVGAVVTEREVSSARAREQQTAINKTLRVRAAGEIAAAIAHEINQPLTAIKTYAAVASKALHDNTPLAENALKKLTEQNDRAALVIKSIRDLLHQGHYAPAIVNIEQLLSDFEALVGSELALRGITLTHSVPPSFSFVWADEVQLSQALHNLVNNSADAILSVRETGNVSIIVARGGEDTYSITVSDDGPGFPPGFNTDEPTLFVTTKADGSGIGLSIARTVAEVHGGHLEIQSSRRGAAVRLILPTSREVDESKNLSR